MSTNSKYKYIIQRAITDIIANASCYRVLTENKENSIIGI